jgi:FAD/FMN-containing dehydrogenase
VELIDHCLRSGIWLEAAHINCRHRLRFYTHAYKVKHGHEPEIPDWAGALFSFAIAGDREVVDFQTDWVLGKGEEMFGGKAVVERDIVDSWWTSKHTLEFEPLGMNAYLEHPNSIGLSLSCAVFVDYHDQRQVDAFRAFVVEMSEKAIEMGGTSTTYMSDTYIKRATMRKEAGEALGYYRALKELFDPQFIMNTGKKWDDEARPPGGEGE